MVGGGFRVTQDVMPYIMVAGYPIKYTGVNSIGLKRRGFSEETINTLKTLFRFLTSKKLTTQQIHERIENEVPKIPEVIKVLEFIKRSDRGVIK
jgi:UDP-N-acetylglucosamine acyltransferase